jgi:hypothetical protein
MFQLTAEEFADLQKHIEEVNNDSVSLRSQIATLKKRGKHRKYLPYVFTEQGIAMLSGLLNSEIAINMNIAIMRAFVEIRKMVIKHDDLSRRLIELREEVQQRLGVHDAQLSSIYDAIENLLDGGTAERKWAERERIGFQKPLNP